MPTSTCATRFHQGSDLRRSAAVRGTRSSAALTASALRAIRGGVSDSSSVVVTGMHRSLQIPYSSAILSPTGRPASFGTTSSGNRTAFL